MSNNAMFYKIFILCIILMSCSQGQEQGNIENEFIAIVKNHPLSKSVQKAYIDSLNGVPRFNIDLTYESFNLGWTKIVCASFFRRIEARELAKEIADGQNYYYFSLNFNMNDGEALFEVDLPTKLLDSYNLEYYEPIASYVISEMSPSDMNRLDICLELYHEQGSSDSYDKTFYELMMVIAKEGIQPEMRKILHDVYECTKANSQFIDPTHIQNLLDILGDPEGETVIFHEPNDTLIAP